MLKVNNRYKCKAKRKDNKEWVEGLFSIRDFAGREYYAIERREKRLLSRISCDSQWTMQPYEVIPETVGQCTGLKDKNGKWIFEGDVVNALLDFGMPIKSICVFKDGSFGLLAKQHGVEHFHAFTSICNVKYEVIGNIYDNPELLEVER